MTVDNATVERVAVGLADRDDEFSWHWHDDDEKERYRSEARKLVEGLHCASCDGHACG